MKKTIIAFAVLIFASCSKSLPVKQQETKPVDVSKVIKTNPAKN